MKLGKKIFSVLLFVGMMVRMSGGVEAVDVSWSVQYMSLGRSRIAGTKIGNSVLFGGGYNLSSASDVSRVDIFNILTNQRTQVDALSIPRHLLSATTVGSKALFAGGQSLPYSLAATTVDIYDNSLGLANNLAAWSSVSMSSPRSNFSAVTVGTKAMFIGGYWNNTVDIYDDTTGLWSVDYTSIRRGDTYATVLGDKVFIVGEDKDNGVNSGVSDVVDIYDNSTGQWTVEHLSEKKTQLGVTSVGNKVLFAGGFIVLPSGESGALSDVVDIYDNSTGQWTVAYLSEPKRPTLAATVGQYALFVGGSWIDVYDSTTDTWSILTYPPGWHIGSSVVVADNKVYFAGSGYTRVDVAEFEINQPPVADAGVDQIADEGSEVILSGLGSSDPDGIADIVSYQWDFGDGNVGSGLATTHTYTDNGVYTATLTVMDTVGEMSMDTVQITVNNVVPTATLSISDDTIFLGGSVDLSFSGQYDPSLDDTTAGFSYSYDCEGDGVWEATDTLLTIHTCIYPNAGLYTAKGRITDKDGGYSEYTATITVQTPAEAISDLVTDVELMNLQQGIDNSLDAKLDSAVQALTDLNENNDVAAINSLQSFINAVEAQRDKAITSEQADYLIAYAQAILNSI